MMRRAPTRSELVNYRRGTVVGLTLAEIFILLLFLLLLGFFALDQRRDEARKQTEARLETLRPLVEHLEQAHPDGYSEQETKEVVALSVRSKAAEARAQAARSEVKRVRDLNEALMTGSDDALRAQARTLERQVTDLEKTVADQRAEVAKHKAEVAMFKKGENPPCWYSVVAHRDEPGETREKPHYTFNVAVEDDSMTFLRVDPWPPGRAEDDDGPPYAVEAAALNLHALPYDQLLTDSQVVEHFERVHEAGENEEVRTYSCKFWVRVWDMTSEHAKGRWKTAHEQVLEALFGTYLVQNDPWPGKL